MTMSKKFVTRAYSIADFVEWNKNALLDLSPEFQRRSVWTRAAKSYLIDTILRGKPMPKVLLTQDLIDQQNVRTVVDGQQRIRSILEFVAGDFTVMSTHNEDCAGKTFDQLDSEVRATIFEYEIGVDLLYDVSRADMLDIFARINTYSVTLNRQEKLNAKYIGVFKIRAYELGHKYVDYLLEGGVLSQISVSRMGEAELASDLLMALIESVQPTSNIGKIYKKFEELEEETTLIRNAVSRYERSMQYIGAIFPPDDLKATNWQRPLWFYTLFTCASHSKVPVVGLNKSLRPTLTRKNIVHWRSELNEISAQYDRYTKDNTENVPKDFASYIDYSRRRTANAEARIARANFVLKRIARCLR